MRWVLVVAVWPLTSRSPSMTMTLYIKTRSLYIRVMRMIGTAPKSSSDARRDSAARRDAAPALLLLLVTQGSLILLNPGRPTDALGVAWALSPLLAVAWLSWNQLRALRRADELQRVAHLEALAIGFGAMSALLVGVGLLQAAEIGDVAQLTQTAFIGGVVVWVGALATKMKQQR